MSALTTFVVKKHKPEPTRNLEKTNRNRTVSSEPRVTDISVNRGSPSTQSPEIQAGSRREGGAGAEICLTF